ncbi:MAG: hypothetical protein OEW06_05695 [Gemmatimonadota bacterium]|nr:hypothetical protein [Gemmatimonadota bacterium]
MLSSPLRIALAARVVASCRFLIGCVLVVASACGGPAVLDGEVTTLIVRGAIEDADGAPVSGAIAHVSWRPGLCDDMQPFPPDTTSADGEFAVTAWGWGTYTEVCVGVRAKPPAGRALRETSVQVENVRLRPQDGPDTLVLRLTLPANSAR